MPINAAIDPNTRDDQVAFGEDLRRGYKQLAFFTSLDFDIIPKVLTITGGTRYFHYTEDEVGSQYGTPGCTNTLDGTGVVFNPATGKNGCGGATAIGGGLDVDPITGMQTDFHKASYTGFRSRGNLTWHITPDVMAYYTFSQGYRPGAFNRTTKGVTTIAIDPATGAAIPDGVTPPTGFKKVAQFLKPFSYPPDSLTNNEIGFKTEFLNTAGPAERLGLPDDVEGRPDRDLQPTDLRQHDLWREGADVPCARLRAADHRARHRAADPAGIALV